MPGSSSILVQSFGHLEAHTPGESQGFIINAFMNIQVRVLSKSAQAQIKALQGRVAQLEGELATANRTASAGMLGGKAQQMALTKWGNQLQWTGRQLQYNWTLPLLLAGGAATKFQLDNEKAFTHIQKVYGDTQAAAAYFMKQNHNLTQEMAQQKATQVFRQELDALRASFEQMSSTYGVAQKDVLDVASAWAAAGASGLALAKNVDLTMKTMILGDMDAAKATEALISIQAQYGENTKQLARDIAYMNAIENQTAISMPGLIQGFARAAGVAREAGVDVRHLGAMLAALTPATGSASQAGNALKTIISRLMSPTEEAAQVMEAMGLNINKLSWQSATVTDRLKMMADSFKGLSSSQKQVAASVIASRWQINKFDVLMRALNNHMSYYYQALDATRNKQKAFAIMQRELNKVLTSSPQRLAIIWNTMKNGMADAIQPLIPYILYLANLIRVLVTGFTNLDPSLQKLIMLMLLALAAVGPLVRYFGSLMTLVGTMGKPIKWLARSWLELATVEKVVDGETRMVRRSFLAVFGSMLMAPFRFILSGFGAVAGMLMAMARFLKLNVAAGILWARAWAGIQAVWALVWSRMMGNYIAFSIQFMRWAGTNSMGAAMVVMFRRMWTVILAEVVTGFAGLQALWVAGMARLAAANRAAALITGTFTMIMSVISMVVTEGLARVALIFVRFGAELPVIMAAAQARVVAMWQVFVGAIESLTLFLRSGIANIWTAIYMGISRVMSVGSTAIVRLWTMFQGALVTIVSVGGRAILAAWEATQLAMATVSRLFWTGMGRLWAAGTTGLVAIVTRLPFIIKTVMTNILWAVKLYGPQLLKVFTGPWGWAITAVLTLIGVFHKQIAQIWNNIIKYFSDQNNWLVTSLVGAWNQLPNGVRNALVAVVKIVREAALAVYNWFSYINPFAHHSPSLVENVTKGMAEVNKQFGTVNKIQGPIKAAYAAVKQFGSAVAGLEARSRAFDQAQQRAKIKKFDPAALASYDHLAATVNRLTPMLNRLKAAEDAQQKVVDAWKARVDKINSALDRQQKKLDQLQGVADKWSNKLSDAQDRLQYYASAPLKGMGAMNDAIHENEMAQKRLQLQMMKMEDASGTIDDVQNKLAKLAGEQEKLRGTIGDLRSAGAGSEITGPLEAQVKALEAQRKASVANLQPLQNMQSELDKLQRKATELDLQKSLKFDDLTYQIEKAANATKELSFDQIMKGIKGAQSDIDKYTQKLNDANDAVAKQQKVVDSLTKTRDAAQAKLDAQQKSLDRIQGAYQALNDVIQAMQQAMNDAASAADNLQQKLDKHKKKNKSGKTPYETPGLKNFKAAAGGNFPDVGGAGKQMRTNWKSQAPDIKKFTNDMAKQTAQMFAGLNPFTPIKKKWNEFKAWLGREWMILKPGFQNFFSSIFDGIKVHLPNNFFKNIKTGFGDAVRGIGHMGSLIWKLLGPDIRNIGSNLVKGIRGWWGQIQPELAKFKDLFGPMGDGLKYAWSVIKPILALIGGAILFLVHTVLRIVGDVLEPAFKAIGAIVGGFVRVIRGILEVIVGIFTGNFKMLGKGILDIITGTVKAIVGAFIGLGNIGEGVIKGFVDAIVSFFKWLYDVLVGHSIVPDMVDAIIRVFKLLISIPKWIWNNVLKPIYDFFVNLWKDVKKELDKWWSGITSAWSALKNLGTWMRNQVLKFVEDAFTWVWNRIKNSLQQWWSWITAAWNALKALGGWFKTNILNPVFDKVRGLWTDQIKPEISQWVDRFKNVWNGLTKLKDWFVSKVLDPIKNAFVDTWKGIRDWFDKNGNMIVKPIAVVINAVVSVINHMIDGLNAIANALPGIDWHIGHVPAIDLKKLASGGEIPTRTAGRGMKTVGARAIIGEGKQNYPEFVVPTDPTHRNRARGLLTQAAQRLGMAAIPMHADGGILGALKGAAGKVGDWTKNGTDWMKGNLQKLASAAWGPFDGLVNKGINSVQWDLGQQMLRSTYNQLKNVVTSLDDIFGKGSDKINAGAGGGKIVPVSDPGNPHGHSIWKGGEFSNLFIAHMQKAEQIAGAAIDVIQGGFRPATSYSGTSHQGDAIDLQVNNALIRALRQVGIAAGDRTGLGNWSPHVHAVPGPSAGYGAGSAVWQWQDYLARGGQSQSLTSPWGLANGGIVKARRGGTMAQIAEAGRDEAVIPLPRGWRADQIGSNSGGDTVININGNLEFPNIKSGDDAETLIANLKSLAGGGA